MAKPDPALLDPANYSIHQDIPTRFGDLDPFGHVNNVAMAAFFEDARGRFNRATGYTAQPPRHGQVVATMTIDYLGEATYPQVVVVHTGIGKIGRTSIETIQLATQNDVPVALSRSIMVYVEEGKATALPPQRIAELQAVLVKI